MPIRDRHERFRNSTNSSRTDNLASQRDRENLSFPKRLMAMAISTSPFTLSLDGKPLAECILELPNR